MSFSPAEVEYQLAHSHDSKERQLTGASSALAAVATVFVLARVIARLHAKVALKADDYTIVVALILSYGYTVGNVMCAKNGLGKHLITVTSEQMIRLEKALYSNEILFPINIMIVQLSFLAFYIRVFTLQDRQFGTALWLCAVLAVGTCVTTVFATIFQCSPIAFAWNKTIVGGHCINAHVMWIIQDVLFLVVDLFVVVLPLPLVWGLQMKQSEKIVVIGMFLLGGFIAIVNLIRLPTLLSIPLYDITYDDVGAAIWSQAEICLGIVAACLPILRHLLRVFFSFSKSITSKSSYFSLRRGKGYDDLQLDLIQKKRSDLAANKFEGLGTRSDTWISQPVASYEGCGRGGKDTNERQSKWKRAASEDSGNDLEERFARGPQSDAQKYNAWTQDGSKMGKDHQSRANWINESQRSTLLSNRGG